MSIREAEHGIEDLQRHIRWSRPYIVFFVIWGCQGLVSACLEFLELWFHIERWEPLPLMIAAACSALAMLRIFQAKQMKLVIFPKNSGVRAVIPILLAIGAVWTLGYVHAIDPLYTPLLKSFILAAGYAQLGVWLGRPFTYMGIWLFVLTLVVAFQYLGFASVLLGGFGGVSMLALGWLLYKGNNQVEEENE